MINNVAAYDWNHSPDNIEIIGDEAHVWRASLDQDAKVIANLAALLSQDGRQRAMRYHRPVDRDRFIVGRGILRRVISGYLALSRARHRVSQRLRLMVVGRITTIYRQVSFLPLFARPASQAGVFFVAYVP
jgi:hypothetical protein